MAVVGLIVLYTLVPNPQPKYFSRDVQADTSSLGVVLRDKALLRLNFGIFSLHLLLTALFIAVPLALVQSAGLDKLDHWMVYLPVMLVSFVFMVPFIIIGEKRTKLRPVF